jgi:hypothetical protein
VGGRGGARRRHDGEHCEGTMVLKRNDKRDVPVTSSFHGIKLVPNNTGWVDGCLKCVCNYNLAMGGTDLKN